MNSNTRNGHNISNDWFLEGLGCHCCFPYFTTIVLPWNFWMSELASDKISTRVCAKVESLGIADVVIMCPEDSKHGNLLTAKNLLTWTKFWNRKAEPLEFLENKYLGDWRGRDIFAANIASWNVQINVCYYKVNMSKFLSVYIFSTTSYRSYKLKPSEKSV